MKNRIVFVILGSLVAAAALWLGGRRGEDEKTAQRLLERASHQRAAPSPRQTSEAETAAFEALAEQGKGQPLPADLVSSPDPAGFWFVGNPGSPSGVEIPFAPGQIPAPPESSPAPKDDVLSVPPGKNNPGFLGASACRECHQERHDRFVHTAHYRTSNLATADAIMGSFLSGENRMQTKDPEVSYEMIQRDQRFYQRILFHDWRFEIPFGLVTGSSKLAQTFLYWHHDKLYQMNVSYLSESDRWVNSPGFVDGDAAYARPIGSRCLECHTTYVEGGEARNQFDPSTMILGISCERCHGPGKPHVDYHRARPEAKGAKYIGNPSTLTRQQQLDICGQCHTGVTPFKTGPYQFRPGDRLADHYESPESELAGSVHTSNQIARLSNSRCFIESEMTCNDCHNPHQQERGQSALFSQRCIKCHQVEQCGMHEQLGDRLGQNCVDCHMPSRESDKLWLKTPNATVFPKLRDHYIRVDDEATETFLKSLGDPPLSPIPQ